VPLVSTSPQTALSPPYIFFATLAVVSARGYRNSNSCSSSNPFNDRSKRSSVIVETVRSEPPPPTGTVHGPTAMFNGYYGSTSESSDSDAPPDSGTSVRTLDLNYLMLNRETVNEQLEKVCKGGRPDGVDTMLLNHNVMLALPPVLDRFQHLRVLDISNNRLTQMPGFVARLPLSTLIAKNNLIDDDGFPKEFAHAAHLRVLNSSGNRLSHFPKQLLDVGTLEYLYMGSNNLVEIPKDVNRLVRYGERILRLFLRCCICSRSIPRNRRRLGDRFLALLQFFFFFFNAKYVQSENQ